MSPAVAVSPLGEPAFVRGVAWTGAVATPVPAALTAATRSSYVVPFVRPVTVTPVAEVTGSACTVHVPDGRVRISIV